MKKNLFIAGVALTVLLSACANEEPKVVEQEEPNQNEEMMDDQNKDEAGQSAKETENLEEESAIANHDFFEPYTGILEHIHGLGYVGNQNPIFFASHDGLKVYENGTWYKTKEQNNDYMGFNAVDQGFYTSGHPGHGVNLPNPLGLKRSFDNGQTLENLGLEGESDFHAMGVGYENHTVYVLNGHPNSIMGEGLYVTRDEGKSWTEIEAVGLDKNIFSIAVHPTNDEIVATAGQAGIFLSTDGGENFSLLTSKLQGTSTFFSEDALWYGAYGKEPLLIKYSLESGAEEQVNIPNMNEDAIMYFAQNPQNEKELVFASFNGDVYLTKDMAGSWTQLVNKGEIQ